MPSRPRCSPELTHQPLQSAEPCARGLRRGSKVDPHTGHPLPFQNTVPGIPDDYRTRVRKALLAEISDLHHTLVDNHGAAERGSVISWARYKDMALAAKKVVDATFGSYARRPQLVHDVNLIDLWESRGLEQSHMTPSQRIAEAKGLVQYGRLRTGARDRRRVSRDRRSAGAAGRARGRRDLHWASLDLQGGELVYPTRSLALFVNPENHELLRLEVFPSGSLDDYDKLRRLHLHPRRRMTR
jgi:hypothetical protein